MDFLAVNKYKNLCHWNVVFNRWMSRTDLANLVYRMILQTLRINRGYAELFPKTPLWDEGPKGVCLYHGATFLMVK